jgi:hypothetical protein
VRHDPAQELAREQFDYCKSLVVPCLPSDFRAKTLALMRNAWAAYHADAAWMRTLGIFSDGKPSRDMSRDSLAAERDLWAAMDGNTPGHSSNKAKVYGAMAAQLRAKVELLQSDARGWAGLAGSASAEVEATRHERDSLQGMWRRSQDENTKLRDEVDRLQAGIRRAWLVLADEHESEALMALIPADVRERWAREDGEG